MNRAIERTRGGLWRPEIVRAVLSGHSILGIGFAAVIFLVCFSGTLSVFLREIQRWEQPAAPDVAGLSDAAVARAVHAMAARIRPEDGIYVSMPDADAPRFVLTTGDDDDDQTWIADRDGRLVVEQHAPLADFLTDLHTSLHLPARWGRFIVGLAGVALLSSLISGLLAHPRIFRDAFHLRLGGSRRLGQADLHNRLGVWPLPFHVIVSLTGALLGLSTIIVGILALLMFRGDTAKVYGLLSAPQPAIDARAAPMPDVAAMLATARRLAPQAAPHLLTIHHWGRRDMRFAVTGSRPTFVSTQDVATFGARGRLVALERPAGRNVGQLILGSLGPLHFGWYGGWPMRLAYGLLGLALCTVTSSGIRVWLARRRDKGRPTPLGERLWSMVVWGQAAIIAAATFGAVAMPAIGADTLGTLWAGATFALLFAAGLSRTVAADRLDRGLRRATAILLGAAALLWAITPRGAPRDGGAILLDLALLAAAIAILFVDRAAARSGRRGGFR